MSGRGDLPPPHVTNERIKSFPRVLFQLGTALLIGDAVKFYTSFVFSFEFCSWIVASFGLMWLGWLVLSLLESEK